VEVPGEKDSSLEIIVEWISALIIKVAGIGIAVIVSQLICKIEPIAYSIYALLCLG